jgi:hypothetical protein
MFSYNDTDIDIVYSKTEVTHWAQDIATSARNRRQQTTENEISRQIKYYKYYGLRPKPVPEHGRFTHNMALQMH